MKVTIKNNILLPSSILFLAIVLRFACGVFLFTEIIDEFPAHTKVDFIISQNLVDGNGFSLNGTKPTSFHTPVYPIMLAGAKLIYNNQYFILFFHSLLGTLSVLIIYLVSRELFGSKAALISAFLLAIYPVQIRTDLRADRYVLFILLMLLMVYFFIRLVQNKDNILYFPLFASLAFLTRIPSLIIFLGLLFFLYKTDKNLKRVSITSAIFMLACSPWWIRNYNTIDHILLTRTDTGPTLYSSNCPFAEQLTPDYQLHITLLPYVRQVLDDSKIKFHCEVEKDSYLISKTFDFVIMNPLKYIKLCVWRSIISIMPIRKPDTVTISSSYNSGDIQVETSSDKSKMAKNIIHFSSYTPLLIMGILGIKQSSGNQLIPLVCLGLFLLFHIFTAAGFGFRALVDFVYIIYSSRFLSHEI